MRLSLPCSDRIDVMSAVESIAAVGADQHLEVVQRKLEGVADL